MTGRRGDDLQPAAREAADRAMAAYVERFERDGELPAYDAQAIKRARGRGRFH